MERYFQSARRLWLLIAIVLAVVWGQGLYAAYTEYISTFESAATVWVERANAYYSVGGADDPNLGTRIAPGAEQAEVFTQLLQTNSFIEEMLMRTPLRADFEAARDKERFLGEIRKRFRAQALGTNLVRVSYRAKEPGIAAELVSVALAVREKRVKAARIAATTASITFYQKEFEIAQKHALVSKTALDAFNSEIKNKLSPAEEYQQNQLRLSVEVSQGRLNDLRQRLERGTVSTALLDMAESLSFQIIDQPRAEPFPSGGTRTASLIAGVALAGGVMLVICLITLITILSDRVETAADLKELTGRDAFGVVPRFRGRGGLHAALSSAAFLPSPASAPTEARTA